MTPALTIKPLLKRGALLAAANWEVVVLQYIAESAFKLMLVVPVAAGGVPGRVAGRRQRVGPRRHAMPVRLRPSC